MKPAFADSANHGVKVHVSCGVTCCALCVHSGPFVSAEEVSALLVQAGMFDTAMKLATNLSLPLVPILEALASRYVLRAPSQESL